MSAHATHLVGSALSDPYLSFAAGMCGKSLISLFIDDPVMPIIFKKEDLQLRLFGITDLLT